MTPPSTKSSHDDVTASLCPLMSGENNATNMSQLQHRINLLISWFGDLDSASNALSGSTVLEIGCGQGDMTLPLGYFAHQVVAVDPAPLDYGSPATLGQAQAQISNSAQLGGKIQWVQRDPVEYMQGSQVLQPDFVVLAHSIFYLESTEYFANLLRALTVLARRRKDGRSTKLLIAEWAMQASNPAAEAHVLAARAQATNPLTDGNVRTVIVPADIQQTASKAEWKLEKEALIVSPEVEDGQWEVDLVSTMPHEEKSIETGHEITEMERVVNGLRGQKVASMDVWAGVFVL